MRFFGKISRRKFVTGAVTSMAAACIPLRGKGVAWAGLPRVAGEGSRRPTVTERVSSQAEEFPLGHVRLLEGPFLDAAKVNESYLESLPEDRLMHNFLVNAGLPSTAEPLGGWERPDCELRGHFVGHYLSACALNYASAGSSTLKTRGDSMVAQLAKCQQIHGNGYLSAFPESYFDRLREGKDVWAPFYTIHKILAGQLDMYTYCQNEQALEIAEGMAGWIRHWTTGMSDDQMQRILLTEYGGTSEALLNLAGITGEEKYLELAHRFEQPSFFDPLSKHEDELKGLHVNTNIPKVIGAARRYELTGDPYYREVATYFLNEVSKERAFVTGGTSDAEYWRTDPGNLSTEISVVSEECCCGYNMLKLTRHVYGWTADPRYMDYYERTLFNSRLGTQNAEGLKMYYLPLQAGYWKYYNSKFNSFWCCTGTGAEEFSKMGNTIYFRNAKEVFVNLLIPSEAQWPEKGITIRQETKFPEEEGTTLTVKAANPVEMGFNLRVPSWAVDGGSVEINGETIPAFASPGSYLKITRVWKDGDRIAMRLPMRLHTEPLLGAPAERAALYGPIVLAGRLGKEKLTKEMQYDTSTGESELSPRGEALGEANIEIRASEDIHSASWVKPAEGKAMTFETVGQKSPNELIPLNRISGERYAVYWKIKQV